MLKKFSKFLLITLVIFVVSSSSLICLAHEDHEHTNTTTTTETTEGTDSNTSSTTQEIHEGDLYLIGNEVVMDQLVDGNVFIIGNKVKITGQVNGNLYVLASQINFDGALIRYSMFLCSGYMYLGTGGTYEGDVYIACHTLETSYNSYAARDFKVIASDVTFKSAVGRNVDLVCNTLDLGEGSDIPLVYGDLNYTANKEIAIPENILRGDGTVTYTATHDLTDVESILDIVIGFGACIVTALALYIILNKLTPKFIEKVCSNKFSVISLLKAFGIGLATIAIVSIFVILLVGTMVGIALAVILSLLFAILCIIATPVLTIKITNSLKPALKIEKTSMFYLVIVLISIILHGIALIPFVGGLLGLIINITAIGLIVNIFLPHKELTDEEKLSIENKKKRKQEKLEAKAAKKQEKLKTKEAKQKSKETKKKK